MSSETSVVRKWMIVGASALVGLLHVLSLAQVGDQAYRGYRTDQSHVIREVSPGGPADRAGFRPGDRITRIAGVDVADSLALDALPPARPGETRAYVVDRGGRLVTLDLTFEKLPGLDAFAYLTSGLTGICFLVFGLWAYLRVPAASTRLLALTGIGLGATFVEMPYFASPGLRALQDAVLLPVAMFGFVFLLHFFLVFPIRKRVLAHGVTLPPPYVAAAVVAVAYVAAKLFGTGGWEAVGSLAREVALVLVLTCFTLAVVAFVHGYVRTERNLRSAWGLNVLLVALLLGFAPIVPTAIALVAPRLVLLASEYYDLVWVLIPFALARAAVRQARAQTAL
jgi:PDZ domain